MNPLMFDKKKLDEISKFNGEEVGRLVGMGQAVDFWLFEQGYRVVKDGGSIFIEFLQDHSWERVPREYKDWDSPYREALYNASLPKHHAPPPHPSDYHPTTENA